MKFFVLFLLLSLFAITCYAEEATPDNQSTAKPTADISHAALDKSLDYQYHTAIFYQNFYMLERNLSRKAFAETIKERFVATDCFYQALSEQQKNQIYSYYKQNQDFKKIRSKIFNLFFKMT